VRRDGEVEIEFRPIPLTKDRLWLLDIIRSRERFATWGKLSATTRDGKLVMSDYVYLGSRTFGVGPNSAIRVSGTASRLRVVYRALPKTTRGVHVRYSTVGMQGFSVQVSHSRVGEVRLAAPTDLLNTDDLAGFVAIIAAGPRSLQSWLATTDVLIERILDMVSFAEGRFIRWSIRYIAKAGRFLKRNSTVRSGRALATTESAHT
jgi:hypothetical protein